MAHRAAGRFFRPRRDFLGAAAMTALVVSSWGCGGADAGPAAPEVTREAAASIAAPTGDEGACVAWAEAVCGEAGASSEGCATARESAAILPPSACAEARAKLPATIEKLHRARAACDELVSKLCDDLGRETDTCKLVQEKTPAFPAVRCEHMLDQYDDVVRELEQMEARNKPLTPELAAEQARGDRPSFGPENALVTVVEYADFECPYCAKASETVHQIEKKYGGKVRFVFRQYPLAFHKSARLAAEAALAAHAQGKFWPFHDRLYANQKALEREDLESYAKEVGLDMAKFERALDQGSQGDRVNEDIALGERVGVTGTPTMFVGTQRVRDAGDFAHVSTMIDEALAAAQSGR
jgi:protein-disulfide isomerase